MRNIFSLNNKSGLAERKKTFEDRNKLFQEAGFDRVEAADFVVDSAGPLEGPALDVGTGKGTLARAIALRGIEVVSVDIDEDEQELARLLALEAGVAEKIRFIHCDASSIPFPGGYFGCVAMMDALHHLEHPERILREMVRVLRPGGVFIIADFNEDGFDLVARVHGTEGREHPRFPATVDGAVEKLIGIGLQRLKKTNGCFHHVAILKKEYKCIGTH